MPDQAEGDALVSTLSNDPEMTALVEMFVAELPDRVRAIEAKLAAMDYCGLAMLAHQLKGAAGGYGFQAVTDAAGLVEQATRNHESIQALKRQVEELAALCERARAVTPQD